MAKPYNEMTGEELADEMARELNAGLWQKNPRIAALYEKAIPLLRTLPDSEVASGVL